MDQIVREIMQFERFALDLNRCSLLIDGRIVELRPKAFEVLRYLATNPGQLVSKDDLYAAAWPGVIVGDDSLSQCIHELRQHLGDTDRRLIKTISRRGYVLDARPVAAAAAPPALVPNLLPGAAEGPIKIASRSHRRSAAIAAIVVAVGLAATTALLVSGDRPSRKAEPLTLMAAPSVAILPFRQVGHSADQTEASSSVASNIATGLAGAGPGFTIKVKTVEGREEAGPGTRYALRGSVHVAGNKRQINVQLVEAQTDHIIWGQIFDDVPAEPDAQNRIVTQIVRTVSQQLLVTEGRRPFSADPSADDYALLGRAVLVGERSAKAFQEAQALFEKALSLNRDSVHALQGLARTSIAGVLNGWTPTEQRQVLLDRAEANVRRVLELAPRSLEGHLLRGGLARARNDNDQAIAAFEHTLNLNRSYPNAHAELGRTLIEVGRSEDAIAHIQDAVRLSPTDQALFSWCYWAGMAAVHTGDYEAAVQWLLRSRQANRAYENTSIWLALAYAGLGKTEEAAPLVADFLAARPGFTVARWAPNPPHPNPIVSQQRTKIAAMLVGLGIKPGDAETRSVRSTRQQ
jgi:DNA-binding winged helix-turn-helix (wHTH) protein/tetratricopeptide (TPR) repeat protein